MSKVEAVLLDIEGTTTPITFVKDVLFPYARSSLVNYLTTNWEKPEVQDDISAIRYADFIVPDCMTESKQRRMYQQE